MNFNASPERRLDNVCLTNTILLVAAISGIKMYSTVHVYGFRYIQYAGLGYIEYFHSQLYTCNTSDPAFVLYSGRIKRTSLIVWLSKKVKKWWKVFVAPVLGSRTNQRWRQPPDDPHKV